MIIILMTSCEAVCSGWATTASALEQCLPRLTRFIDREWRMECERTVMPAVRVERERVAVSRRALHRSVDG